MQVLKTYWKSHFLLCLFIAMSAGLSAQTNLYLNLSQSTKSYALNDILKISFDNGSMLFLLTNKTTESYLLSSISTFSFSQETGVTSVVTNKFNVYPNPAKNRLFFNSVESTETSIAIFQLNGKQVLNAKLSNIEQGLDISSLTPGFYLIKVNNQTSKFSVL